MAELNTWEKISARLTALDAVNKRMDETAKYLYWDDNKYTLTKPDGKTKITDAISITPNKPKVFAHGIIANLLSGKWQTVVDGKISDRQKHLAEQFVNDNFAQADEYLQTVFRIPSLDDWLCNHVCARGPTGVEWISSIVDKQYKVHCVPVDMRWCPFEDGGNGLSDGWIAPITFRTGDSLRAEGEQKKWDVSRLSGSTELEVRDHWDAKKNEVWVAGEKVFEQSNPFGYPPFVVMIPSAGFMLRDKGYLKYEGQDILFLNKGLFEELARTISLQQTAGYASIYPGYEKETPTPGTISQPTPDLDESLDVLPGERHQPLLRGDMSIAGRMGADNILKMIEEGGRSSPNVYNTPPSAVELFGEAEMIGQLQNCRKDALGALKSQLAMMIIDQAIKVSKGISNLEIGGRGRKNLYNIGDLGDPDKYFISYRLTVKSKRQELANLAEFEAAKDLPMRWRLENILEADDTDGIMRELEVQQAKEADPAIGLHEMALRLVEEADKLEDSEEADAKKIQSMMLTERGVAIIKQRQQPAQSELPEKAQVPQVEENKGNANLLPALIGATKGGLV